MACNRDIFTLPYISETAPSLSELHGVTSQKTALFRVAAVTNPPSAFLDMFFPKVLIIQFILLKLLISFGHI
jgi:hypothetical protein